MKISLFGISGVPLGKHNVKDPQLDQADKLVEAKKKVYIQVDAIDAEHINEADAVMALDEAAPDLILRDLEFVESRLSRDPAGIELGLLPKLKASLEKEEFLFKLTFNPEEQAMVASYGLVTVKPTLAIKSEQIEKIGELWLTLVQACGYLSFLTLGGKENRAWQIKKGTNAWEAAGAIHSDIQKGFIRAEIISFADLVSNGGETQAKRAGKMRLEPKDYLMQDYDVVNFRFNK